MLALKMEEGATSQECGWPLEAGQCKEMKKEGERKGKEKKQQQGNGFPLEQEGRHPC